MGMRYNDGINGTKIEVPTVEPGELSAYDANHGHVGRVRKNGQDKVYAGELLLTAVTNGGELLEDSQYIVSPAWKEACRVFYAAKGQPVRIQFPRGIRKQYSGPGTLKQLIQAIAAGGFAIDFPKPTPRISPTVNGMVE